MAKKNQSSPFGISLSPDWDEASKRALAELQEVTGAKTPEEGIKIALQVAAHDLRNMPKLG